MNNEEKIALMEEIMDLEEGTLHLEDVLADYEEWDSLSVLTYITELAEKFGRDITGEEVKSFVTVADAVARMNK